VSTPQNLVSAEVGPTDAAAPQKVQQMISAATFIFLFISTLIVAALLLAYTLGETEDLDEILFEAASALGSVGLSSGITGADMPTGSKYVLMTAMWIGRLEVVAGFATVLGMLRGLVISARSVATSSSD
jgi:trk system potassium uptake protein TrkH